MVCTALVTCFSTSVADEIAFFKCKALKHLQRGGQNLESGKNIYSGLSLSRLRLSRITAYLEEKIWFFFKCRNQTSGNEILWIRGEIAKEQFLPFSTIFSVYIFNLRSQITYLFVKFGCSVCIFLSSANLLCRSMDISKCFRGSPRLQDNKS